MYEGGKQLMDRPGMDFMRTRQMVEQGGAAMPMGNSPRPNIPMMLDEQSGLIVNLHNIISELENRLAAVLSHDEPIPAEAGNRIDPPPMIQVTDRLAINNRGLEMAQRRLGQLMQRLHL